MKIAAAPPVSNSPADLPDPQFWVRYSPRLEFSISTLASITVHVFLLGVFFVIVARLMQVKGTKAEVPIRAIMLADESVDSDGGGTRGAGGGSPKENVDEPVVPTASLPEAKPVDLASAKASVKDWVPDLKPDDQLLEIVANSSARDKLEKMDPGLRDQLLKGLGDKKGKGDGPGRGAGSPGAGEGTDTEQSKSRRRALGWTIQFDAEAGGRDYLDKLASLKATLIFQRPGSKELEDAIVFTELKRGAQPKKYEPGMINGLFFIDDDLQGIRGVVNELNIPFRPRCMIAVFPKDVEEELAKKSMDFRGRREEDISRTVFRVYFVNGGFEIRVESQVPKRGKS